MSISLTKGEKISLEKSTGGNLTKVKMGLGWDAMVKKGFFGKAKSVDVDLDASCLLLDSNKNLVDTVWFAQLVSKDGSIVHTGDNLTGEGEGDDESIIVDLNAIPATITTLIFTVNSYSGEDFTQITNAFCRLLDLSAGQEQEMAKFELTGSGQHTALIVNYPT